MKRRLSLLLAVVMILGSFTMAFAAEESAEAKAGAFLKEVGVLEGINGDLKLEDNLRRQDMVVLIARLHGAEEEAEKFPTEDLKFTDFKDPYYRPIIAWAVANELIEGHTPERFGFNENVTAQQYATVLLRALGYNDKVADKEGYAKALEEAKELGILENVEVENDTVITRGQMAAMTFNALGVKVKDSDKTLAEKLGIEMPAPEVLEVEEVKADNLKEIKVVFNKDVDEESAVNSDNYITNAPTVKNITYDADENTAVLLLDKAMTPKKEYKITIKGVKDDKTALNVDKTFVAIDNSIPEVVEVVGLGTKAIKVIVSEPIEDAASSNFKLDGKTLYANVSTEGREVFIRPYSALGVGEHELTVSGLKDFAAFKSLENKYAFEVVEDKEAPTVVEAVGTTNRVVVTFSEDVDHLTVNNKTVYWKSGASKKYPESYERLSGNKFAFYFSKDNSLPVHETTLFVEGVADYSGNKMATAEIAIKADVDLTRPEVMSVKLGSDKKTITVKFNKPVDKDDAGKKDNYRVLDAKDNKQIISKIEEVDARTFKIVLLSALKADTTYTLKISGIKDTNKYANVMVEYSEELVVADYVQPKFEYAYIKAQDDDKEGNKVTKIVIYFNKSMDLATLVNPSNYLVEMNKSTKPLTDVDNEIDMNSDGSIVTIYVTDEDYHVTKVGVLGVKDNAGNLLSNYGVMKAHEEKTFALAAESFNVKAKDTIELEFTLPIKSIKSDAFSLTKADIKSVEYSGTEVTLTVDELHAGLDGNELRINKDSIESFDGQKIDAETRVNLVDKIAPSIDKVTGKLNDAKTDLVLTVKFDEDLKHAEFEEDEWKEDLIVKRLGENAGTINDYNLGISDDTLTITIPVEVAKYDSIYQVEVNGARAIVDTNDNKAKNSSGMTEFVEGIEKEVKDITGKDNAKEVALEKLAAIPPADAIVESTLDYAKGMVAEADKAITAAKEAGWTDDEIEGFENYNNLGTAKDKIAVLEAIAQVPATIAKVSGTAADVGNPKDQEKIAAVKGYVETLVSATANGLTVNVAVGTDADTYKVTIGKGAVSLSKDNVVVTAFEWTAE